MVEIQVRVLLERCPLSTTPLEFGGYYGYEKGFLGYASNKYKDESRKEGKSTLGDDYIIKKLSDNKFSTLEDWKKAYFNEVVTKAKNGIQSVEIDGTTYNSYEDLKQAFSAAVERDRISLKNGLC